MTNKFKSAVLAATAVLTVSLGATAATAATAPGSATANIVAALSITEDAGLNFGTIIPDADGGNIVIDFSNGPTCNLGLVCSGTVASGAFTITGTANQGVTIATDASTTISNGAVTMTVDSLAPSAANDTLDALGQASFTVGGRLLVGGAQAPGVYTGNYDVTVNYQ